MFNAARKQAWAHTTTCKMQTTCKLCIVNITIWAGIIVLQRLNMLAPTNFLYIPANPHQFNAHQQNEPVPRSNTTMIYAVYSHGCSVTSFFFCPPPGGRHSSSRKKTDRVVRLEKVLVQTGAMTEGCSQRERHVSPRGLGSERTNQRKEGWCAGASGSCSSWARKRL